MRAIRFNHVSIHARDLEESVRFYVEIFGMERIPNPNFRDAVAWLRLADQQLHIFERETPAPEFHHLAFDVDDFEAVYLRAKELGIEDGVTWYSELYELPDGAVQFYLRDPAGNLVEIDWPDISSLDRSLIPEIRDLNQDVRQTGDALRATLYLDGSLRARGGRASARGRRPRT